MMDGNHTPGPQDACDGCRVMVQCSHLWVPFPEERKGPNFPEDGTVVYLCTLCQSVLLEDPR